MEQYRKGYDLNGYSVRLVQLLEEDGGGWLAEVPELDGCMSDGETPDDALSNVADAIECWLAAAVETNAPIPKPSSHNYQGYSGKFTLRMPKTLHRSLAHMAEREGVSLNQLVNSLLAQAYGREHAATRVSEINPYEKNFSHYLRMFQPAKDESKIVDLERIKKEKVLS